MLNSLWPHLTILLIIITLKVDACLLLRTKACLEFHQYLNYRGRRELFFSPIWRFLCLCSGGSRVLGPWEVLVSCISGVPHYCNSILPPWVVPTQMYLYSPVSTLSIHLSAMHLGQLTIEGQATPTWLKSKKKRREWA